MSVQQTAIQVETASNGSNTAFSFSFKIFASTDLLVYTKPTGGSYTLKTLNSDYTVAFDSDAETGTVTFGSAPATGTVKIKRSLGLTQATVFPREGALPSGDIEDALDRVTLLAQELGARITALGG